MFANLVRRFADDDSGATAIEYGLIAALIAIASIVVMGELGTELNTAFTTVKDDLKAANTN